MSPPTTSLLRSRHVHGFRIGLAVLLGFLLVCTIGACVHAMSADTYEPYASRVCNIENGGKGDITCKHLVKKLRKYADRYNVEFRMPPQCAHSVILSAHHTKCGALSREACKAVAKHKANAIHGNQNACNVGRKAKANAIGYRSYANKAMGTNNHSVSSFNAVTGSVSKTQEQQIKDLEKKVAVLSQKVNR